jgi:hypothetical protein
MAKLCAKMLVKLLQKENLKFIQVHMLICMHQEFALVKLNQVVRKKLCAKGKAAEKKI